jgi:hypothetical protein
MKQHGAASTTIEQQAAADRDLDENQLKRSSWFRDKKADSSKLPDNNDDKKLVPLKSLETRKRCVIEHGIDWKDFLVAWRNEVSYRLLIK